MAALSSSEDHKTVKATVNSLAEQFGMSASPTSTGSSPGSKGVVLDPAFYLNGVAGNKFRGQRFSFRLILDFASGS